MAAMLYKHGYYGAGVCVICKENDTSYVLLGKRAIRPAIGMWHFPGGKRSHKDKYFWDCAVRECWEETGYKLNLKELGVRYAVKKPSHLNNPWFRWFTYVAFVDQRIPVEHDHENMDMRWVPVDELRANFYTPRYRERRENWHTHNPQWSKPDGKEPIWAGDMRLVERCLTLRR
jgi:8-oxo-dGTP pyrophosphatase MutT (NUDIX family)